MKVLLAIAALVLASAARSDADVIPRPLLFSILDGAHQIKREKPPASEGGARYYSVTGSNAEGFVTPELDDYGFLSNGADLLIVPLGSGGSGGVFQSLLFTSIHHAPKFIGTIPSPNGHLLVTISEGAILVTVPNYGKNDPNCCPSSLTNTRYSLSGIRLHKLSEATQPLKH